MKQSEVWVIPGASEDKDIFGFKERRVELETGQCYGATYVLAGIEEGLGDEDIMGAALPLRVPA